MVMAMYLRNALEDCHVANLNDRQMKELNQIVRRALYEITGVIEQDSDDGRRERVLAYLVSMIPDYWEVPDQDAAA